jgi:hypothetical protein
MLPPLPRCSGWTYSSLVHPAVSAFPERVVGSACTSSFSRIARRSLALRPAHSRCHQFVTRIPKASAISLPPWLLRLLPAGAVAGWGLHPLENAALSRRTPFPDIPFLCRRVKLGRPRCKLRHEWNRWAHHDPDHRIHPGDNCICNDARRKRRAGDGDTPVRQNEHRRGALAEARDAFLTVLDHYTLADLAKPRCRLSALFPEPRPA